MPTIEDAFAASSIVVHGVVTDLDGCTGDHAWTFVQLEVDEVLRGSLGAASFGAGSASASVALVDPWVDEVSATCDPGVVAWTWPDLPAQPVDDGAGAPQPVAVSGGCSVQASWGRGSESVDSDALVASSLTSSETFTFRVPYGEYPDGTRGTIVDTPGFSIGDEVVVFLTYDENGEHLFVPFSWMAWSVYRVFRGNGGQSAVVNGFGEPVRYRTDGVPWAGQGHRDLRHLYWQDPPIDDTAAGQALNQLASAVTWPGTGRAIGPWRGRARVSVTGPADSSCNADLKGLVSATTLDLRGRCNAGLVGAVDIELDGTFSAGAWAGTATFTAAALPEEPRTVSWASTADSPDRLFGAAAGVIAESGYSFTYDLDFRAGFVGPRPLMSFGGFRNYLLDLAFVHDDTAGVGTSIAPDSASCNFATPVWGAP